MSNATPPAPPAAKKSRAMLFAIIGVIVGLGGGGGAYWLYASRIAPPAAAKPAPPPTTGIVPMEPFVVNLADEGGSRFLRVTLSLVVEGEEHAKEIAESDVVRARLRSAILERLTLQKGEQLVTPEGKSELKKAIAEQAAHAAHGLKVTDVLFSEFVVQF
jgi:flagellar FliL protein